GESPAGRRVLWCARSSAAPADAPGSCRAELPVRALETRMGNIRAAILPKRAHHSSIIGGFVGVGAPDRSPQTGRNPPDFARSDRRHIRVTVLKISNRWAGGER
ncbi:hypothetical protein ACFQZ8_12295, partial [Micromonospora azadirachtae]